MEKLSVIRRALEVAYDEFVPDTQTMTLSTRDRLVARALALVSGGIRQATDNVAPMKDRLRPQ